MRRDERRWSKTPAAIARSCRGRRALPSSASGRRHADRYRARRVATSLSTLGSLLRSKTYWQREAKQLGDFPAGRRMGRRLPRLVGCTLVFSWEVRRNAGERPAARRTVRRRETVSRSRNAKQRVGGQAKPFALLEFVANDWPRRNP